LYNNYIKKEPEKIHNLNYFIEKLDLKIDTEKRDFIDNLSLSQSDGE